MERPKNEALECLKMIMIVFMMTIMITMIMLIMITVWQRAHFEPPRLDMVLWSRLAFFDDEHPKLPAIVVQKPLYAAGLTHTPKMGCTSISTCGDSKQPRRE